MDTRAAARAHMRARALTHAAQAAVDSDVGLAARDNVAAGAGGAGAAGSPAQAAQAGLSKSSRGALAGLGADIARLYAWLRAGAARRGKEGGSSASSPYAWGKGGGCAGAGKGSEATGAMPGKSAPPMLVGGQRRCRVGVGASEALVGALGVGGERTGFG